jgi:hypothetical protein
MLINQEKERLCVATLLVIFLVPCLLGWAVICSAEETKARTKRVCCGQDPTGILWHGSTPRITFEELARYCGPILWFSPDEPLLDLTPGAEIRIPEPVPFEEPADSPVVYYRVRRLLLREGVSADAYESDPNDTNASVLHLDRIGAINLDYFFYYSSEEGLGRHPHDVESAEFMLEVIRNPECPGCEYAISVKRVVAKAHGLDWYDNTLNVDDWVAFPLTLLAEEGKHASCTDKNGDGYYSPGYDVNTRINDAWGCRDVIRTGALFTASYQSWMTKVRRPNTLVVPPLPEDSPHYDEFLRDDRDLANKAAYVLRPFPSAEPARGDAKLFSLIDTKGYPEWPVEEPDREIDKVMGTLLSESFTRSLGVAYRYDGLSGVSFVFPLLIVKNVEEPLTGGWLVNRIYTRFKPGVNDYGWNMLYTPSASRWFDPYFSLGVEIENQQVRGHTDTTAHFAFETGVKFRGNLAHTPLKFMTFLTDFWGLRVGLKYLGFAAVDDLAFVIEVGAGVW